MKTLISVLNVSLICVLVSCSTATLTSADTRSRLPQSEPDAVQYNTLTETQHFKVYQLKSDKDLSADERKVLIEALEGGFQNVSNYLGADKTPAQKLIILLEGEGMQPGKPPEYPSVDSEATTRLYRFRGLGSVYLQGLPHELVHAFRMFWNRPKFNDFMTGFGFVEEGFAEYVAKTVDPSNVSFPTYGYPLDLVTGYWISNNQDIPLSVLFNHHEINPKCVAQAYPLRSSFLKYLNEQYGKQKLFQFAYYENEVTENIFNEIFEKSFSDLNKAWKIWVLQQYDKITNKDILLQEFVAKTPIKYFPVCSQGKDW